MSKKDEKDGAIAPDEIESLNVDDLDIEELERRIELASAMPMLPDGWICGADCGSACGANCGSNCVGLCSALCAANVCGSNSGCTTNGGGGCLKPGGSSLAEPIEPC